MALSRYLCECAERAAGVLGYDVEASITVREHGVALRGESSSESAARCDEAEVRVDDGPCIDAILLHFPQVVADVAEETRWTAWREQTVREGFVRAVAVPAGVGPGVGIALNLYSRAAGSWSKELVATADAYVQLTAAAVRLHLQFADLDDAAAGVYRTALDAAVVQRALGAIMETDECLLGEAARLLAAASREQGVGQRTVAESILRSLVVGGYGDILDDRER